MQYEENSGLTAAAPASERFPINMDEAELNKVFASYMPRLLSTARQILHNHQDAEDALQDGLLSAFRNLHQFQGRSRFSSWLHSIIANSAKMHLRKRNPRFVNLIDREMSEESGFVPDKAFVDRNPDPEQVCLHEERFRILVAVLRELPPTYQSVIQLCDIEGWSGPDAAISLGIALATVKTRLHRARRLVSWKIGQNSTVEGGYSSAHAQNFALRTRQVEFRGRRESPRGRRERCHLKTCLRKGIRMLAVCGGHEKRKT